MDHRTMDDADVVAAAQKGHRGSFDILVQRYERSILLLALRITRNVQDAEDVRQESFHKAFVHLDSFKGQSSFSTWLTRIAINEALMLLRKNRARREVPAEETADGDLVKRALETLTPSHTPERDYLQQEREQILCIALERLTPGIRAAIEIRELEERTTKETAEILGISPVTVKSRVFRGRRKLQEVLNRCVCLRVHPEPPSNAAYIWVCALGRASECRVLSADDGATRRARLKERL